MPFLEYVFDTYVHVVDSAPLMCQKKNALLKFLCGPRWVLCRWSKPFLWPEWWLSLMESECCHQEDQSMGWVCCSETLSSRWRVSSCSEIILWYAWHCTTNIVSLLSNWTWKSGRLFIMSLYLVKTNVSSFCILSCKPSSLCFKCSWIQNTPVSYRWLRSDKAKFYKLLDVKVKYVRFSNCLH